MILQLSWSSVAGETTRATAQGANTSQWVLITSEGATVVPPTSCATVAARSAFTSATTICAPSAARSWGERRADVTGALDQNPDTVEALPTVQVRNRSADGSRDAKRGPR